MKILNNTIATGPIAHMCEFPENLVISGNLYTKSPLRPLPMQFAMIEDPDSSIHLKDTYEISDTRDGRRRDSKNTYVEDEYRNGVVWLFYDNINVYRATPNEFGYEITGLQTVDGGAFEEVPAGTYIRYAGLQTKDVIYCWWNDPSNNSNWIGALNKDTMDWVNVIPGSTSSTGAGVGYVEPMGYYYDELNDVYYHYYLHYNYTATTGSHICYIFSLNLSTGVKTQVHSITISPSTYRTYNRIIPDIIKQNNNCGILYTHQYYSSQNGYRYMYKYIISGATTITVKQVYCYSSSYNIGTVEGYKCFIFHPQSDIISCCLIDTLGVNNVYTMQNDKLRQDIDFNDIENMPNTGNYNSRVNQTTEINNAHPKILACGSIAKDKIIFFVSKTKISIWQWNESTLKYDLTNEIEDNIERVGVDLNENIWVRNTDKEVYTVPINFTDYEITISADETSFDYYGQDMSAVFKVKALNKNGVHISCRVKLKITGSALFTQNQAKELELELPGQELEIPITIYDTGIIHIAAIS